MSLNVECTVSQVSPNKPKGTEGIGKDLTKEGSKAKKEWCERSDVVFLLL